MKEKINFLHVPYQYMMCMNQQCTKAETCLRQLVENVIPDDIQCWNIVSPKFLASLKDDCPYYRSDRKVRFAKGFIRILGNLPYDQMRKVIRHLIAHFERRTYYRIRKGERLLSLSEQQEFFDILKKCGVTQLGEFDAYQEDYDW